MLVPAKFLAAVAVQAGVKSQCRRRTEISPVGIIE
jgi:hypothetical protein